MDKFLKVMMFASLAALMLFGVATYARADDCKIAVFSETSAKLSEQGVTGGKLSGELVAALVAKKGTPPGAEGRPFDVYRFDKDGFSLLAVVVGDCIEDRVGPVPSELIDNVLGVVQATSPKGERVD